MAQRSPEDVLSGVLRIPVGGVEKLVPTLPIRATREWQAGLAAGPAAFTVPVSDDDWTAATVAEFTGLSLDTILDVVTSYDRTSALGGREWLEEHADPAQLYAAALAMIEVGFPFATSAPRLLAALVIARSKPPSSTNGRSPTGGSTRGRSKSASTRAS